MYYDKALSKRQFDQEEEGFDQNVTEKKGLIPGRNRRKKTAERNGRNARAGVLAGGYEPRQGRDRSAGEPQTRSNAKSDLI